MSLTISLSYYNQGKEAFLKHLELWKTYDNKIKFIIVDDGSKIPLEDLLKDMDFGDLDISLYRVEVDLFCNIPGAMNLSAKECTTEWILFLDMDTLVNREMALKLSDIIDKDQKKTVYKFNRVVPNNKKEKRHHKIHPKVCLIRKKDFWEVGGYDEDLVGHYGLTDPIFFHRAKGKLDTVFCKKICLIHYDQGEAEIPRDVSHNLKLFEEKKRTGNWCKEYIRFPWKKIF